MNRKVLLVLGGSSDVGVSFIKSSYNEYDKVFAQYYSNDRDLRELKKQIGEKIVLIKADFLSQTDVDGMIELLLKSEENITHIVHFPAPNIKNIRFRNLSWEIYQKDIDIQVKSIFKILKVFMASMAKNKYGKIVFMLSSYVINEPPKYLNHYVTVKYALLGLMKALAAEYAEKKLNINAVSPDMMETKFLLNIPDLIVQANIESSPMKRLASVNDVVPAIRFLLSDEASYITGQNINIADGKN